MRRYQKWVLTLGIMAVTPGIAMAGLPSFLQFGKSKPASSAKAVEGKLSNQQVAENIAAALRSAKLKGFDVAIEYKNGIATLTGQVADLKQKANATKAVSAVRGVRKVDNKLILVKTPSGLLPVSHEADASESSPIQQAEFSSERDPSKLEQANFVSSEETATAEQVSFEAPLNAKASNQAVAQKIADALSQANLRGFDIEIRYRDGIAGLAGAVSSPQQIALAEHVVASVPEVNSVDNQLKLSASAAQPNTAIPGPVVPVGYQMAAPQQQAAMMQAAAQPAIPGPPSYGHPGTQASNVVYNNPNLPQYAWPAYAPYPNAAQVSYPTEYSASAWPYIGPFYPYPQIPLGWRQAQLEWDDGYWNLNFRPRTDRWYWFLNPKNW